MELPSWSRDGGCMPCSEALWSVYALLSLSMTVPSPLAMEGHGGMHAPTERQTWSRCQVESCSGVGVEEQKWSQGASG